VKEGLVPTPRQLDNFLYKIVGLVTVEGALDALHAIH